MRLPVTNDRYYRPTINKSTTVLFAAELEPVHLKIKI